MGGGRKSQRGVTRGAGKPRLPWGNPAPGQLLHVPQGPSLSVATPRDLLPATQLVPPPLCPLTCTAASFRTSGACMLSTTCRSMLQVRYNRMSLIIVRSSAMRHSSEAYRTRMGVGWGLMRKALGGRVEGGGAEEVGG